MLEILALLVLLKRIGKILEQKGRPGGWYKLLTVGLWVGGEFIGAIVGVLFTGSSESTNLGVYLFALLGAAVGAAIAYAIVSGLSPVEPDRAALPGAGQVG